MTKQLTSSQVMELKNYVKEDSHLADDRETAYMLHAIRTTLEVMKVSKHQIELIVGEY